MLLVFAATGVIVTSIVLTALDRVADYANRLDEERSRETVTGAIRTFKYQLGATLNDYANWDDAAEYVYNKQDADWIVRNFGDMTFESDLFDVAILLDQHGRSVMAYSDGEPITEPIEQFVNADVRLMLDQVKSMPAGRMPQMVGFTKTAKGVAAAGIAMIRMKSSDNLEPPANPAYLVFMRHLSAQTVARVGQAYVLPGLQLTPAYITASHRVNIRSPSGYGLGALGWEPRAPGDISREQVRPLVTSATVIVGIYCLLLVLVGAKELRRVRADEAAAVRMSRTDRLSGLANREGLFVGLADRVGRARLSGEDVGLLYLDLDGFKEVNDAYGHATGDRLIRGVAAGLRTLVAEGDTIARVGGDEFAIVVSGANAEARSVSLCNSILEFLGEPFSIGERVAIIGCSIGLCVSAGGATEGEELVRRADMAMYCSKENGRGRWTSYDPRMDDEREERNRLELDLRAAIDNDEITVVYQPVVDVRDRELVSVEALARWNRAGHGLVPPDVFIPVAEASGMIDALGISVLRQACAQMRAWPELGLSVNVSPGQFRDPAFASRVAAVLADTGMNPHHLVLEMTETYFVRSPERAIQALERLRKIGVQIALDDFGAGFSSVGYLRKFGFDRMKIDRSMVSALDGGQNAVETLQATVALARSMGIPVTAEGVETEEQAVALRLAGCDELQGYLFGKPSAPEAIEDRRRRSAGRRAHTP
ncbi:bifunctional diguanylate cyclase/phosphodiesterase [Ciceribacter naphthalenivorans]|uniref:Bifunctional diguanylate cyclase/phosphodiesterase n=3 Tax=Pseudomonadota TaxID=1224 RepID=A0A512HJ17_9HYPH|nr:bifunctional diguanylate cyclase/phosphodiesterase [Ciceribacter naphthalenivorans]GLR21544.1 bifunctional diguanylate cyclase/phosphodiesterase [Ciceribacter naphthalenivorans]GLT04400.1 bifunctional diguanylate cyclase/phosphodiesterase [Sphingomonas psychrolutea]